MTKTLIIYGQLSSDDELQIYGNRDGLFALRNAVNRALATNGRFVADVVGKTSPYNVQVNCKTDDVLARMPDPLTYCEEGVDDLSILNWIDTNHAKIVSHAGWLTKVTWGDWQSPQSATGKTIREAIINAMNRVSMPPSVLHANAANTSNWGIHGNS
jgi:hypothetical protein